MRHAFVDSGVFGGLLVAEDEFHARAKELLARARTGKWHLVTTNAVVFEAYTLIRTRARSGRERALSFLDTLDAGACDVERVTPEDEFRAATLLRRHADKDYSFCDALSFTVMERIDVSEAISFDRHFREYGRFTVL